MPLSTVRGVRGATGATLGEVLLTASAGAVRDYFRVTGLPLPEEVSCTVPVYSQRWAESRSAEVNSPGLVTLALPTGAADPSTALCLLRQSIKKIRNYPERYLASVWLMRNVAYFLPGSLLGAAFRALSSRYPVFMSNLAGPQQPVSLWGHDLVNVFHWRPPCDGAGKTATLSIPLVVTMSHMLRDSLDSTLINFLFSFFPSSVCVRDVIPRGGVAGRGGGRTGGAHRCLPPAGLRHSPQ